MILVGALQCSYSNIFLFYHAILVTFRLIFIMAKYLLPVVPIFLYVRIFSFQFSFLLENSDVPCQNIIHYKFLVLTILWRYV